MTRPSDPQLPAPDADEPELEAYAARLRAADEARLAPLLAQARADAFAVARGIEAEVAAEERTAGGRRRSRNPARSSRVTNHRPFTPRWATRYARRGVRPAATDRSISTWCSSW